MRLRGRTALLLLLPFAFVAIGARVLVPAWGDWVARQLRFAVAVITLHPAPRRAVPLNVPPPDAPVPVPVTPVADAPAASSVTGRAPGAGGTKRTAASGSASVAAVAPGPLRIPASKVQHAIDDGGRSMHARTTYGPDGKPIGARITGVNGAGLGLRDGDIIVAIDGKPTMDDDAATDAALGAVARGDSVLHATLTRDGQPFDVAVELPLAPINGGKNAR